MILIGARQQTTIDSYFDASGTITTGGTAQLLLPQRKSCSHLVVSNVSTVAMQIQFGVAPAKAVLTNGVVTSVTVSDAGFGFQCAPDVFFFGGGNNGDLTSYGATMPGWPPPANVAVGNAVMGTSSIAGLRINSIALSNGGSGYSAPPFVQVVPSRRDPTGVGLASSSLGIPLQANGGSYYINGTSCPTEAISIWCGTTGAAFTCKWLP